MIIVGLLFSVCKGLFNIISCVFEKFHSKDREKRDTKGDKEEKQARMVWPRKKGFSQFFLQKNPLLELVT